MLQRPCQMRRPGFHPCLTDIASGRASHDRVMLCRLLIDIESAYFAISVVRVSRMTVTRI